MLEVSLRCFCSQSEKLEVMELLGREAPSAAKAELSGEKERAEQEGGGLKLIRS